MAKITIYVPISAFADTENNRKILYKQAAVITNPDKTVSIGFDENPPTNNNTEAIM